MDGGIYLSMLSFIICCFYSRYEFGSTLILPLIFSVGTFFLPESRRWQEEKQKQVDQMPVSDYQYAIDKNYPSASSSGSAVVDALKGLMEALLSSKVAFAAGMMLAIFQQITGINAILMYAPDIVETAGIDGQKEKLMATVCIGFWNFITTIISFFFVCPL